MNLKRTSFIATLLLCLNFGSLGCLVKPQVGGSTHYPGTDDDVQYFAPGPEFKLSREAAAKKAYKAEVELREQGISESNEP